MTVKRNQPTLYDIFEQIAQTRVADDCYESIESGRGRTERRIVSLWKLPKSDDPLAIDPMWISAARMVRVERLRRRKDASISYECHYYLTSRRGDTAYELGRIIRGHWHIENRLHWVKDVMLNEDRNRISGGEAAENLSLLKTLALTLYRINGISSFKHATICFANKIKELWNFFTRT